MLNLSLPLIDFLRNKDNIPAKVVRIERYADYNVPLAQLRYADGERRYILAPIGLSLGDSVLSGEDVPLRVGNCMPLRNIPVGVMVHNVEIKPGEGGQLIRTAGSVAIITKKDSQICTLRLPSGRIHRIPLECRATVGRVSHVNRNKIKRLMPEVVKPLIVDNKNGDIWFDTGQLQKNIAVSHAHQAYMTDDAQITAEPVALEVYTGEELRLRITATNTGKTNWTAQAGYSLGMLKGYEHFVFKRKVKLDLDRRENITPGMNKSWEIGGLIAPEEEGKFELVWQMYKGDFEWFGTKLKYSVNVIKNIRESVSTLLEQAHNEPDIVKVETRTGHTDKTLPLASDAQTSVLPESRDDNVIPASGAVLSTTRDGLKQRGVSFDAGQGKSSAPKQSTVPSIKIAPPQTSSRTRCKISITNCTPRHEVLLSYEYYSLKNGWMIVEKKLKADKEGSAGTYLSWEQSGTYDVWVKDIQSGIESRSCRVTVS